MESRKPVYVLDATPVIHFAKMGRLSHVLSMREAYITREVYREAVDRGDGRPDAMAIRDAVERGEIKIHDVRQRRLVDALLTHPEIHRGEAETLAAAKELNAFAIVDEAEARAVGRTYAIQTRTGTLFLLFKLLTLKRVGAEECLRILDELVDSGLYIDSLTLRRARQKIERGLLTPNDSDCAVQVHAARLERHTRSSFSSGLINTLGTPYIQVKVDRPGVNDSAFTWSSRVLGSTLRQQVGWLLRCFVSVSNRAS